MASLAEPLQGAREMLLAWNGRDLLLLAGGDFAEHPAGYTALAKGIAAAGAPDRVEAARAQLATGANAVELPALDGALRKALESHFPRLREMQLVDYKVRVINERAGTDSGDGEASRGGTGNHG